MLDKSRSSEESKLAKIFAENYKNSMLYAVYNKELHRNHFIAVKAETIYSAQARRPDAHDAQECGNEGMKRNKMRRHDAEWVILNSADVPLHNISIVVASIEYCHT